MPQHAHYASSRYRRPLPLVLIVPHRGFGALSQQNQSIAGVAAAGASTTVSLLVALGTIGGPVGAAIAGVIAVGMALVNVFGGCGNTCVEATNVANQVGPILGNNLETYLSAPIHYASMQAAALNNFDTAWAALLQGCNNPALGSAGKACVSDRQAGGCTWKVADPFGWTQSDDGSWTYVPAGAADPNGTICWNWFSGMRDPIANDPTVVPDPVPASAVGTDLLSAAGISSTATIAGIPVSDLVLPAALIVLAMLL
jgi:hypothetical protein